MPRGFENDLAGVIGAAGVVHALAFYSERGPGPGEQVEHLGVHDPAPHDVEQRLLGRVVDVVASRFRIDPAVPPDPTVGAAVTLELAQGSAARGTPPLEIDEVLRARVRGGAEAEAAYVAGTPIGGFDDVAPVSSGQRNASR